MDLCVETCRAAGGMAEVLALVLLLGRWLWAEYHRRQKAAENVSLRVEKASLEGQVRQLSTQPPPLERGPSLHDLAVQITGSAEPPALPTEERSDPPPNEPPASKSSAEHP